MRAEILTYSRARGLFAGISLAVPPFARQRRQRPHLREKSRSGEHHLQGSRRCPASRPKTDLVAKPEVSEDQIAT